MLVKYTDGEVKHQMLLRKAEGMHAWYKRLNVDTGLQDMKLDNWESLEQEHPVTGHMQTIPGGKTLKVIQEATDNYLARSKEVRELGEYAPPNLMIKQTAEKLVRCRRAREKSAENSEFDKQRWDSLMGRHL
jgi:hypothetical protein